MWVSGEEDRRREKRVRLRAGGEVEVVLVVGGGEVVVSLWPPKRGILMDCYREKFENVEFFVVRLKVRIIERLTVLWRRRGKVGVVLAMFICLPYLTPF